MFSQRAVVLLFFLPLFVLAQNSSSSRTITTTILSTSIGLGQGRETTTVVASQVITTVIGATPSGNTTSGNSTSNSTSSSSTSTRILPTAPTSVNGGGGGGAPSPGASSPNGVYGPNDSYIAAATTTARNAIVGCLIASAIAGVLLIS